MEVLAGWGISSMPGPPLRQHEHERRYTPFTLTRWIWNDDYDGQMIFGDLRGLKLPEICPAGEEKPLKNFTKEIFPDRGSSLGPLRDRRACYRLLYSGTRILPEDQLYSPHLDRKISDFICILNCFLLSSKSGEATLPLNSIDGTRLVQNYTHL